jgi:hypothetical protein
LNEPISKEYFDQIEDWNKPNGKPGQAGFKIKVTNFEGDSK